MRQPQAAPTTCLQGEGPKFTASLHPSQLSSQKALAQSQRDLLTCLESLDETRCAQESYYSSVPFAALSSALFPASLSPGHSSFHSDFKLVRHPCFGDLVVFPFPSTAHSLSLAVWDEIRPSQQPLPLLCYVCASFNKYLLFTKYVPGTVEGAGVQQTNKSPN